MTTTTDTAQGPDPNDFEHGDSLGACMRRVFRDQIASVLGFDPRQGAGWAWRWPRSARIFTAAIKRIGGPVWFLDRGDGEAAPPQVVVAAIDEDSGFVSFATSPPDQAPECRPADRYTLEGKLIRR